MADALTKYLLLNYIAPNPENEVSARLVIFATDRWSSPKELAKIVQKIMMSMDLLKSLQDERQSKIVKQ